MSDGHFALPAQSFEFGENRIKVIATDLSGNAGSAEVVATWTAPRFLILEQPAPVQEGLRVVVPVTLMSTGGVAGATFLITYDTNYLADAQLEWSDAASGGLASASFDNPRQVRATFTLPGTTLPEGSAPIALLNFRARSVPTNLSTQLHLDLVGIYADSGDQYTNNNFVQAAAATITQRKAIGDVNANNRLDVGDASLILQLVTQPLQVRSWDRRANDLNKNGDVDSGDVIRVLRAIVGLDPQPTVTAGDIGKKAQSSGTILSAAATANGFVSLVADKMTAAAGEKVTVEVRVSGQTKPLSGASFRLEYPVDALRLDNSTAHGAGALVPSGVVSLWNLSPNQNNYATQSGAISLAVSGPSAWPTNNGVLARFTFTVQSGAAAHYGWPVLLKNLEVSHDGFATEILGDAAWTFIGHAATPASFAPEISFNADRSAKLILHGDIGASYRIEASSDLATWTDLGTLYSADGSIIIQDTATVGAEARFYKATLVP
jgi:hypothetical protein